MYSSTIILFIIVVLCQLCPLTKQQYTPDWNSLDKRPLPTWYGDAKIGIFIHWGVFSVPSYDSEWFWYFWKGPQPRADVINFMNKTYPSDWTYADFANQFRAELFDPNEWADIFAASGAKYIVLTSKHHEGFTMWPSKHSFNWNAMDVGPKRDLVGDLANAIRNRTDIVFGLYHSLYEWFNPLYLLDKENNFTTKYFSLGKSLPELYEIVEAYKPEILWSDGAGGPDTYWNSTEFIAWLYNESPVKDTVVVNDRWGYDVMCKHGDFYTCHDSYNPGYLITHKWENCFTLAASWGYRRNTQLSYYRTMPQILTQVVTTVSCGGNVLMNVGPTSYGKIDVVFEERLRQLGSWLAVNGEAIYSSILWKYQNDTINSDVWYTSSKDGQSIYGSLLNWPNTTREITFGAPKSTTNTVITLLGSSVGPLKWQPASGTAGITVDVSNIDLNSLKSSWTWVFKFQNITSA